MVNPNYIKGYRFQLRVKKELEKQGYYVQINPKSSFPDGIAVKNPKEIFFFECKVNKYLSREEKKKAKELMKKHGIPFRVFFREKRKIFFYSFPYDAVNFNLYE